MTATRLDIAALAASIARLRRQRPRHAAIVRLRIVDRQPVAEIARLLKIPEQTARRAWTFAKAWLLADMHHPQCASRS